MNLGIIHFHLGENQDRKNPQMIEGTKNILYAFIQNKNCYFITIDKHGRWNDEKLLELLNKNFPKVLKPYKVNDVTHFSVDNRKDLWGKNVFTLIPINGKTYIPPGGGTSIMGNSINASKNWFQCIQDMKCIEKKLVSSLKERQKEIETKFNKKIDTMDLSLFQVEPCRIIDMRNYFLIELSNFNKDSFDIGIKEIAQPQPRKKRMGMNLRQYNNFLYNEDTPKALLRGNSFTLKKQDCAFQLMSLSYIFERRNIFYDSKRKDAS